MSEINRLHDEAMDFAAFAFHERARGNAEKAHEFFEQALKYEVAAIDALGEEYIEPTYSVLHRSAATLALDCKQYRKAEQLAAKALAQEPPGEIAAELWDVLERAKSQRNYWDFPPSRTARLTFGGEPVIGQHGIMADFAVKALAAFEKAFASVSASLSQEEPLNWKGPIPNHDINRLLITNIAHGSFGFEFENASRHTNSASKPPDLKQSIGAIMDVLYASLEYSDDDELAGLIGDFDRRAAKDLSEFLGIVAKNDATCAIEFDEDEFRFHDVYQVKRSATRLAQVKK